MLAHSPPSSKCSSEPDMVSAHIEEPGPGQGVATRTKRAASRSRAAAELTRDDSSKLDQILALVNKQNTRLDNLESYVREIRTQNNNIQDSNTSIISSVENITGKLSVLQTQIETLEGSSLAVSYSLSKLQDKVERLERSAIKTAIEIRQVPKKIVENRSNLYQMLEGLSASIGHPLIKSEVKDIYRQPSKATDTKSTVLVEFTNTFSKSNFLTLAKKKNRSKQLGTRDLGGEPDGETSPIYISERLTSNARHLYFLARDLAKTEKYAYCWINNGQVLLRKEAGGPHIIVKTEAQLAELKEKF